MPIYHFHVDADVPERIVAARLRSMVRDKPSFWHSLAIAWEPRDSESPPFIGTVRDTSFSLKRQIGYRNAFLPLVRGRLESTPTGTRVCVTMFLHPAAAIFTAVWLCTAARGALSAPSGSVLVPWGMFAFGVMLVVVGFFPEAFKARRLISAAVLHPTSNTSAEPSSLHAPS